MIGSKRHCNRCGQPYIQEGSWNRICPKCQIKAQHLASVRMRRTSKARQLDKIRLNLEYKDKLEILKRSLGRKCRR